ncbi:arylamine N-acetyltransferase [Chryseobacterium sp. Tr-659]|uniref:arylamine N-acetyltransferase family protein n=1 Tax=Chryseobacterium sp. Tr-659 TaxID=2608340 RepID=UPI00141FE5C9|nr:arylamine N-acetyltransferase [Chryseobacterium sp. Tr-659]NIF06311.1 arylamine N-acetyltransferase [Chryseobacterium sp. Tr-659]
MDQSRLEKYLERIHYTGEVKEGDWEVLKKIHQLHPQYIPFENIDSYTGKVPSLHLDDIFKKLITDSRGGYCFEQNLLLKDILTFLGFKTDLQQARVLWRKDENSISAKSHLLLITEVENKKYLVDCGFGTATLTAPLLLNDEGTQETPNGLFKISQKEGTYILWTFKEQWFPVYRFDIEHVEAIDLELPNWYLSTHPESNFKKNLVLSKVDENARYTFTENTLNIRHENGGKESIPILNNTELFDMLKDTFGLKENAIEALKVRAGNE